MWPGCESGWTICAPIQRRRECFRNRFASPARSSSPTAACNVHSNNCSGVRVGLDAIQHQEGQHAVGGGALVPVQKRVIFRQRYAVLGGGFVEVFGIGVGLLRLPESRFQQALVAHAVQAAEGIYLVVVNRKRRFDADELRHESGVGELLERRAISGEHLLVGLHGRVELGRDRGQHQPAVFPADLELLPFLETQRLHCLRRDGGDVARTDLAQGDFAHFDLVYTNIYMPIIGRQHPAVKDRRRAPGGQGNDESGRINAEIHSALVYQDAEKRPFQLASARQINVRTNERSE